MDSLSADCINLAAYKNLYAAEKSVQFDPGQICNPLYRAC